MTGEGSSRGCRRLKRVGSLSFSLQSKRYWTHWGQHFGDLFGYIKWRILSTLHNIPLKLNVPNIYLAFCVFILWDISVILDKAHISLCLSPVWLHIQIYVENIHLLPNADVISVWEVACSSSRPPSIVHVLDTCKYNILQQKNFHLFFEDFQVKCINNYKWTQSIPSNALMLWFTAVDSHVFASESHPG